MVAFACEAEIGCVEELADGGVDPASRPFEPAASPLEPSDPSPPPRSLSPARRPSPPSVADPDSEPEPWGLRRFAAIDVLDGDVVADASVGSAGSTGSVGCAGSAGLDAFEAERSILARSIRAATIGSSGFSSIAAGSLAQPAAISDHARIVANLALRDRQDLADPFIMERASSPHALKFPAATP